MLRRPWPFLWLATTAEATMAVHRPIWLRAWPARSSSSLPVMANHAADTKLASV